MIEISPTLYHVGPPLELGPLPSFFYFALSGPESLTLAPYNQPVEAIQDQVRVFSLTLPLHDQDLSQIEAMEAFGKQPALLEPFLLAIEEAVNLGIEKKLIDPLHLACGGLSRGAFIATHLAARDLRFRSLLGFAPLTRFDKKRDLIHLAPKLINRHIRLYIGNLDTRVGTRNCFDFAQSIAEASGKSANVDLIITKSIGKWGHGTSTETFQDGAIWLLKNI